MFIKETTTTNKKTGKKYVKHTLVESVRTEKGPRQRTIMQLGRLELPRSLWPVLVGELKRRLSSQQELPLEGLEVNASVVNTAENIMEKYYIVPLKDKTQPPEKSKKYQRVDLGSASTSYSRSAGAELVAHKIWQDLRFPELLKDAGLNKRERSLAEAVVAARLIHPASENETWNWLRKNSAICEFTESQLANPARNAVYKIADTLLEHKDFLESKLMEREKALYPERDSLYLFDLTNFYIEGQALGNELARRGKSKQKRNGSPLVSLGMVVDSKGFPIISRVYEGNIGEPTTLKDILKDLDLLDEKQDTFSFVKPTVVMDRGIATAKNITLLNENSIPYIIIERGARNKAHLEALGNYENDPDFELIERAKNPRKIWVKKTFKDDKRVEVLCVSERKKIKEKSMAERWQERALKDIISLQNSIKNGYLKNPEKIQMRIGRLHERYPGFAQYFELKVNVSNDNSSGTTLSFEKKSVNPQKEENPLWGTYVIETSHKNKSATDIWHLYMTLTRVEDAFRYLKSDLGARPLFHQGAQRCKAHLFISTLAYHLLINIEHRLSLKGDNRQWKTIKQRLNSHQRTNILILDDKNKIHEIRQTGQPEALHRDIYKKLEIKFNPQRIEKMICKRV